jgi:N-hydroxyarylamine O-acetyltransferase
MADAFDLDAYFRRIGYAGPRAPTLEVLTAIHALQPAAIPFENLDPLLGRRVRLDLASLQEKLVAGRRGGYCFELNGLLAGALDALGFRVTRMAGRVRWNAPPERPEGARTHKVLRVDLPDGPWLADVGFGGHLYAAPIRLVRGIEQQTPHSTLRLTGPEPYFVLQSRLPGGWHDVYRFSEEPHSPIDYEAASWFTSTHPASLFTGNLLGERLTPEGRISLFNRRLVTRARYGSAEEKTLANPAELAEALHGLGIDPPADAAVIWDRLPPPAS